VQLHAFLNSAPDGNEGSTSHLAPSPREGTPVPLYKEVGWLGHGTSLEVLEKKKKYENLYEVYCGKISYKYIGSRTVALDKGMELI